MGSVIWEEETKEDCILSHPVMETAESEAREACVAGICLVWTKTWLQIKKKA